MGDSWKKESFTFSDILIEHLRKILEITRSEFHGGYWEQKVKSGMLEKVYVANTKKQYIQAVESLSDILLPEYDEQIKEAIKNINTEVKNFEEAAINLAKKQIEEQIKKQKRNGSVIKQSIGASDYEIEQKFKGVITGTDEEQLLINHKLLMARKLFRQLNLLIFRLDLLEGEKVYVDG